jgi:hypothetical protein
MRELEKPLEEGPVKSIMNSDDQPTVLHVIKPSQKGTLCVT